eukprot:TRINITY_DN24222_c0_g1_i1.p1 TRINITY_DN24222_c0_g1~~TRINITY_DN24222_c0_g1_i1.p1  ORF type:complete len:307 (-),score=41.66 TRINITY_DN24222_c0_g1_i1:345-1265(-)
MIATTKYLSVALVLALLSLAVAANKHDDKLFANDAKNLQVALNLEYLEAEFFLHGALGYGLDKVAPDLVGGGPPPIGTYKANLDKYAYDIIYQFGLQEVGHLREIKGLLKEFYFGRVQLTLGKHIFSNIVDQAFGEAFDPPFDAYANSLNFFLATYLIPYVGLTGYVGASPNLLTPIFKSRIAGLLAVEAGQDAFTRAYLYERKDEKVAPHGFTVAEFTNKISALRNKLSNDGILDEGLIVPKELGAEKAVTGNILSADANSVAYARTAEQVFSTVYGTGDASKPGAFYPNGGDGIIAKQLLKKKA